MSEIVVWSNGLVPFTLSSVDAIETVVRWKLATAMDINAQDRGPVTRQDTYVYTLVGDVP